MKILAKIKLSEHKYKTPEGYLICQDAILARTGKQDYYKSEIYEDFDGEDDIVSVDRKEEQVFSTETLASFEDKPITIEHPEESVNPNNYNELAVGHTRNVHRGTFNGQDVMLADLVITDAQAIEDIENGIRTELSCGYDCDITEGPNPQQINIRGNHVALCEQGRAGIAKIIDSKPVEDVIPRKNESQEEFISRFMKETEEEYPDEKQRVAVAYSYWNKAKGIKDAEGITYYYDGPIYRFKQIVIENFIAQTVAKSEKQAINNLNYQAKKKLKLESDANVHIDPKRLIVFEEPKAKVVTEDPNYNIPDEEDERNIKDAKTNTIPWLLNTIKLADNDEMSIKEYFDSKNWDNNMMTRIVRDNKLIIGQWDDAATRAIKLDEFEVDPTMSLKDFVDKIKQESLVEDSCKDTVLTYRGYVIENETYDGIYSVQVDGDDWMFKSIKEAKEAIDDYLGNKNSVKDSSNRKYVLYVDNGTIKGTSYVNYTADSIRANKVQNYKNFDSIEHVTEYLLDVKGIKREEIMVIGDSVKDPRFQEKRIKLLEKQLKKLNKEDESLKDDENQEMIARQKGKVKKQISELIEKSKYKLDKMTEDSKPTPDLNIKEWYTTTYPSDEVGKTLRGDVTFQDLFDALDHCEDVYEVFGGDADSLVRERCFEKLAEIVECDYDYIYEQWLKCDD